MAENTDPIWGLALRLGLSALSVTCVVLLIWELRPKTRKPAPIDPQADAEWDAWVDQALRMSESPIFDQLARQRFEVEALAEIDEMTGGIA